MTRHWPYKVSSPMKGTGEVLLLVDGNTKTVEASQLQWEPGYLPTHLTLTTVGPNWTNHYTLTDVEGDGDGWWTATYTTVDGLTLVVLND